MTTPGNVTQIDADYLNQLKSQLETVLQDVNAALQGGGATTDPNTTGWLAPVDDTLQVLAGASGFGAATSLNNALKAMGGSVHDQLTWLKKVVTDMINEITTTVNSFGSTESLNNETVDQLLSDFSAVVNDFNNPPTSSSSSSSGG